ncbi:helix-turn-helix domain-containing protein [Tsuneonella sp. YG55]|uniref:Helix-turn-helix domain-containing protein n=1 Tax=Tsuneonella litorea TaxID=2976475 RepID=A0A9X3ALR7_9SPHN|nr:helix-turn-helix domain-containing protein [Tsuneonella litorea]MCT2557372.1 helix-turn-helix domain-containing protein [Tsuneonella litorea]
MDDLKPRLVDRHKARELLGNIGDSKLYDLFNRGEIEGVFLDNKRLFVVASIDAYIDRLTNARPEGVTRRFGNLKYCDAR